jgi:hypothetical protein
MFLISFINIVTGVFYMRQLLLTFLFTPFVLFAACEKGQLCQMDIPGAQCADGSQSYISYIDRGSENLFVYVQGGGACFDAVTCGCRLKDKDCKGSNEGGDGATAGYLSRPPFYSQIHPWGQNENGPIGRGNYFEIVYCTGDVYTGAGTVNYGNALMPRVLRHMGAVNFQLSIDKAKQLFPHVKKVTVIGSSAGGVGVTYNLHHIARNFGQTELSVINDSGIPILAKYLDPNKIKSVLEKWNVMASLPEGLAKDGLVDFEDIYEFNASQFSGLKYALLGATRDAVFQGYFALLGGNSDSVKRSLEATSQILDKTTNHKYFLNNGRWHTATFLTSFGIPKDTIPKSHGVNIEDWIAQMVGNSPEWRSLSAE